MSDIYTVSLEEAHSVGNQVGCDWSLFDTEHFRYELEIELRQSNTALSSFPSAVLVVMGRFVQARLLIWRQMREVHDYYLKLDAVENEVGLSTSGD